MNALRWTSVLVITTLASSAFADAKGRVHIQGAEFTVADAVAYKSDDGVEVALWSGPFQAGRAKELFRMMRDMTPRRVRILAGTVDGDEATPDFEGVLDNQPQKGEVDLVRVGGAWYVKSTTMH
jgi:hypothetical protein